MFKAPRNDMVQVSYAKLLITNWLIQTRPVLVAVSKLENCVVGKRS